MAGKLTWAVLSKRPNRVETFISNFGGGSKFEFSNGDYVAIDKVIVGSGKGKVEYSPTHSSNLLSVMASARGSKSKLDLSLKVNGKGRAFGDLEKTEDYGGKPRAATTGSFGGTTTEVLSEVGFCFYYAMLMTGNLGPTYNVNVWKNVGNVNEFKRLCKRYSGTTRMLSYTFRDSQAINKYIPLMYLFLTKEGWDGILRSQVIAFHNKYNLSKMYFISRGDGMPDYMNPYSTFSTIKGAMKEAGLLVLLNKYIEKKFGTSPFGYDFNVRKAPQSIEKLINLCRERIPVDQMPILVGVGDTVTSTTEINSNKTLRGGSDRGFLTLIQELGKEYKKENIIIFVDSSYGEVNRPSVKGGNFFGITDKKDPLKFNLVMDKGPYEYKNWIHELAERKCYKRKSK